MSSGVGSFTIHERDPGSEARTGTLMTAHGPVRTPIFMPVGTQGSVKAVSPAELESLEADIILSNTYHLFIRPGMEVINRIGGLHRFMNWSGPILTDSGGFQVFSLARLRKITDEGVAFQSHVDGSPLFLGPKEAVDIQVQLGSDIMMCFDECPPWPAERKVIEAAVEKTIRWAGQCKETLSKHGGGPTQEQLLFGIVQGSSEADLRESCARALVELDFPGYAIGGVSVGEPEPEMMKAVEFATPFLPLEKPRYTMGLGQPHQLVKLVARGVDMFDCVLPTRVARNGTAYTRSGPINLRSARYTKDPGPIDDAGTAPACQGFSRAYIRHLLKSEEILGLRLVSLHNLWFYLNLMKEMRESITAGRFGDWSAQFLESYQHGETREKENDD
ncbi:MAG: tRNA guanosine(34) transglycosylase Tgt [Verrucomicrobiota bacterium]